MDRKLYLDIPTTGGYTTLICISTLDLRIVQKKQWKMYAGGSVRWDPNSQKANLINWLIVNWPLTECGREYRRARPRLIHKNGDFSRSNIVMNNRTVYELIGDWPNRD